MSEGIGSSSILALSVVGLVITAVRAYTGSKVHNNSPAPVTTAHKKRVTIMQDGSKYAHNVGGYYRFGELLASKKCFDGFHDPFKSRAATVVQKPFSVTSDDNVSVVVVEREKHYIDDRWFLKARNGSTGHLTQDKVTVLTSRERDEWIDVQLKSGIFVGMLENIPEDDDRDGEEKSHWTSAIALHSKEFSEIVNSNEEFVFIVGHESGGVSPEVLHNKKICPLTIETHGSSKKDSSLGVLTVVCTLLNQIRNYTLNPI